MPRLVILGSTGSIGTNTLRVVRKLAGQFPIVGLAGGQNTALLAQQAREFHPQWVYTLHPQALNAQELPPGTRVISRPEDLCDAVTAPEVDIVLCAISGTGGLKPVLSAIQAHKKIALASKEVLVMAGAIVTAAAKANGVPLLPVDSEHCAIFQCLDSHPDTPPRRILLTCSGGPFHAHPEIDLKSVTLEQTLKHPTWNMGRKITIDSATLMNKGLEIIEAGWLFHVKEPQIEVVIHPQSIVHSMVEYADNSIIAQMGYPDMCLPIQYCLTYPERIPGVATPMDFSQMLNLTFQAPDANRFPALRLARAAMNAGGAAGAVFNAANEIAVQAFVEHRIRFDQIAEVVERTLEATAGKLPGSTLDEIIHSDGLARHTASDIISAL